jgi:hypothetical protein
MAFEAVLRQQRLHFTGKIDRQQQVGAGKKREREER